MSGRRSGTGMSSGGHGVADVGGEPGEHRVRGAGEASGDEAGEQLLGWARSGIDAGRDRHRSTGADGVDLPHVAHLAQDGRQSGDAVAEATTDLELVDGLEQGRSTDLDPSHQADVEGTAVQQAGVVGVGRPLGQAAEPFEDGPDDARGRIDPAGPAHRGSHDQPVPFTRPRRLDRSKAGPAAVLTTSRR